MKCSYEEAIVATEALREARDSCGGKVPPDEFNAFLEFAGIGRSSGYVWIAKGPPTGTRRRYELSERAREVLVQVHGRRALAWRMLRNDGEPLPCLKTFQNAVKRDFSKVDLALIEKGEMGLVDLRMYSQSDPTLRNELWQIDTVHLKIAVIEKKGAKEIRTALVTLVVDDSCGGIMGWSMSFSETKADVLVALRDAMVVRSEAGPFGGIPKRLICDRGSAMISNAVTEAAVLVGFKSKALPGAHPWLKGKVESAVKAVKNDFCPRFAHFTAGRSDRLGNPELPGTTPPTLHELRNEFDAWVRNRNETHPFERNENRSPIETWLAQEDVPLQPISRRTAAALLQERETRTVGKYGIKFDKIRFVHNQLPRHRGERVVIAYMPRDRRSIDVFLEGKWLCSAKAFNTLSPKDVASFRNACKEAVAESRRKVAPLIRASRSQIAPITGAGESVEDAEAIPIEKARQVIRDFGDEPAREAARARNELAGITSNRNKPLEMPD